VGVLREKAEPALAMRTQVKREVRNRRMKNQHVLQKEAGVHKVADGRGRKEKEKGSNQHMLQREANVLKLTEECVNEHAASGKEEARMVNPIILFCMFLLSILHPIRVRACMLGTER
jgi:hypothetical protein